jgi:alpha-1,2-mannosyltransferase
MGAITRLADSFANAQRTGIIANAFRGKSVYGLSMLALLLLSLCYQVKLPITVDLGKPGDHIYLRNFHDPESVDSIDYRWSSGRSQVVLRGVGRPASALLRLLLNGARPVGLPFPLVTVAINGHEVASFVVTDEFGTYQLLIDELVLGFSGDLQIEIISDVFVPAEEIGGGDLRSLGILVDSVSVEFDPALLPFVIPPPRQLFCLVLAVAGTVLLVRQLALGKVAQTAAAGLLLLILLVLVVRHRPLLGQYSASLLALVAAANVAAVLGRLLRSLLGGESARLKAATADLELVLLVGIAVALFHYGRLAVADQVVQDRATDFFINYTAASVLSQGGNIYDAVSLREASQAMKAPLISFDFGSLCCTYVTPPFHAVLLLPLVPLGYDKARVVLLFVNNLLLFSSLAVIVLPSGANLLRLPQILLAVLLVVTFEPVYVSLQLGQVDFLLLFLITMCFWAHKTGRDVAAGIFLGLGAAIKLTPAILMLYFLWKRQFRVLVPAVVVVLVSGIVSWVVVGQEAFFSFWTCVLPALLKGSAFFQNQSLSGFFSRLFVDPSFYYSLGEFPSLAQPRMLSAAASIAVLAIGAFVTREEVSRNSVRFNMEFSLAIVTMLLVSSIAWEHYFVWLLLPFLVLLTPDLKSYFTPGQHLSILVTAFLAFLVISVPSDWYGLTLHSRAVALPLRAVFILLISLQLYAALLLYSVFAYISLKLQSQGRRTPICQPPGKTV